MIKRTIYIGSSSYLSMKNRQMLIRVPEIEKSDQLPEVFKEEMIHSIPIEDMGILVLDNPQITLTQGLIETLMEEKVALLSCNKKKMPHSLMLPMEGNTKQCERYAKQLEAKIPLKKQLWQQTISAKIENQARLLDIRTQAVTKNMYTWSKEVKSGDSTYLESRSAVYYWKNIFPEYPNFIRDKDGEWPNNLLNYGYAILRSVCARALVISGCFPTFGIYHHNKYNAYGLADDIMEPYRPYVDSLVCDIMEAYYPTEDLSKEIKQRLLAIPTIDVKINNQNSVLMSAMSKTTASLYKCYAGETRQIIYPILE